jgi:hypothetical protein
MRLSYRYRRRSSRRYHSSIVRSSTTVISCERYLAHNFSSCQDFSIINKVLPSSRWKAYQPLTHWDARLHEQASMFEFDVLPQTLEGFPRIIAKIPPCKVLDKGDK